MTQRRRGRWRVALGVVAAVLVVVAALVWFGQRSLMYHPDTSSVPDAADVLAGGVDVTLTTSDGLELGAWYAPPTGTCEAVVLVAPGNGGNRAGRLPLARLVQDRGLGVLLLDYRGYGGNPGSPTEQGLARDVRAARSHLVDVAGVPADRVVYLGESLGTGVVSGLAAEHPPAALVLRSPMTSFGAVVDDLYGLPLGWVLRDRYPVLDHVARMTVPTAVVHGSADTLVPPEQSARVAQTLREAGADVVEVDVVGAGHNDGGLAHGEPLGAALDDVVALAGITGCG